MDIEFCVKFEVTSGDMSSVSAFNGSGDLFLLGCSEVCIMCALIPCVSLTIRSISSKKLGLGLYAAPVFD